ncbi:hypothetical protein A3H78_01330 [Candidatus Roizmanbacteria bacterium RIFCSPLOWO2_02_FULL_36_11]|uniref:Glycosyltransferase RgtA/B/C/D-like domain-containing protein n=1 Tax=Candidatus Roizmanbacteria bacterium RIFCSPLOWO2_02_FULL_36_11 TaxID=1802071 RepID=A0A1F7JFB7_9BACT|nr:MAG: hypothetical protein A3H78_01330 [Candidatus Roizmanbacteria bacterium RIFCSPLOWO2_02_FULL_36_11]
MSLNTLYKNPYLTLAAATVISSLILWSPFIFKAISINGINTKDVSFQTIEKNWDGPLYIIVAKTWYNIKDPLLKTTPLGLDMKYYAAHLPLYPLSLTLLAPIFGYPKSTVISTLITSILLVCFFYYFVTRFKLTKKPLLLSIVFLFLTPRFLVTRSVGSPEPLLILLVLLSIFFFIENKYIYSGLFGALAVLTKTPAFLLFPAYCLYLSIEEYRSKKINTQWFWLLLIPAGLLVVFGIYHIQYNDFFAYFHSGDNIHLVFPPFSIFNYQKPWVDTAWLEDVLFIFFFYLMALIYLFYDKSSKAKRVFFYFLLVFFISIISVQHRDVSRYSLPMLPLALITFEDFLTSKKFLLVLILLLPAIYFYAWNFMLYNIAPIADWTAFL